jgi:RNA polymerase sigma-70 factor, ECF subfamily
MTTVERASTDIDTDTGSPDVPDSSDTSDTSDTSDGDDTWWTHLGDAGPEGDLALTRLHELLVRASRHQVWRLRGLLHGADATEIDDLAQQAADDAMVAVLRRLPSFEGRSRFTTWAYKFAVLQAGVAVRGHAWRGRDVPLPDTVVLADVGPSPAEMTEAAQLARAVHEAIATELTPHQRRVVLALLVEGVPIDVLADRLGSSRNSLYKALHDARQRLRQALEAGGHLEASPTRSTP